MGQPALMERALYWESSALSLPPNSVSDGREALSKSSLGLQVPHGNSGVRCSETVDNLPKPPQPQLSHLKVGRGQATPRVVLRTAIVECVTAQRLAQIEA